MIGIAGMSGQVLVNDAVSVVAKRVCERHNEIRLGSLQVEKLAFRGA